MGRPFTGRAAEQRLEPLDISALGRHRRRVDVALTPAGTVIAMCRDRGYITSIMGAQAVTAGDLQRLTPANKRSELVRGRLIVREPAGGRHGAVTNRLAYRLTAHVEAEDLGRVYAAETGFKLASDPDTVRAPDVAFMSRERVPDAEPRGFPELAPDLVAEVLGVDDRPGEVLAKVADWLSAGTRLVWVVDPETQTARVYRADGGESLLGAEDILSGEAVVPGFACPLVDLW